MRKVTRLAIAGLTASLLMALAVSAASANRLSVSNRNLRITWTNLEFRTGESAIARCPVTLEGSFHSATIAKIRNLLIGHVSRASVGSCASGSATVLTESLPWHVTYEGFTGTLPLISTVNLLLINAAFRIGALGFFCLARTSTANPARGAAIVEAGGRITGLRATETTTIPTTGSGGFGCPAATGSFAGTGSVTLLGTTTGITVRLI